MHDNAPVGPAELDAQSIALLPRRDTLCYFACVNVTTGATRIIDYQAGRRCATTESTLNWSKGCQSHRRRD